MLTIAFSATCVALSVLSRRFMRIGITSSVLASKPVNRTANEQPPIPYSNHPHYQAECMVSGEYAPRRNLSAYHARASICLRFRKVKHSGLNGIEHGIPDEGTGACHITNRLARQIITIRIRYIGHTENDNNAFTNSRKREPDGITAYKSLGLMDPQCSLSINSLYDARKPFSSAR